MRTDHLINVLTQDRVQPPDIRAHVFAFAGIGLLLGGLMIYMLLGFRPNLIASLLTPVTAMKPILPLMAAIPAILACLALIDPQRQRTPVVWISVAVGVIAVLWFTVAVMNTSPDLLWPTIRGSTIARCLLSITILSLLPLIAALRCLREGASTSPMRSGALAGLAVGGIAAALYSISCDEDSPLFFLLWYSLAMILVTIIGAFLGKYMLRW